MYPCVLDVTPKDNYTLHVTFDNGVEGVMDIKPYLDFGIFKRLKNQDAFHRVRVSFDTVEWDCGVDLDPEFIFQKLVVRPSRSAGCNTTAKAPRAPRVAKKKKRTPVKSERSDYTKYFRKSSLTQIPRMDEAI